MASAERYPLTVCFKGGRIRHAAQPRRVGSSVDTMCGRRDMSIGDGDGLPWCVRCRNLMDRHDSRASGGA